MLIESITSEVVQYKGKRSRLILHPGHPVQVPHELAQKIINECGGKVRMVTPDWIGVWREVARMTLGITTEDVRFVPVTRVIELLDEAFLRGDWDAFVEHTERLKQLIGTPDIPLDHDAEG